MLTAKELNPKNYSLTPEQQVNQDNLLVAVNKVRLAWGKPMIVTSGVRSLEDQMRINPKAKASKHLLGAAVDISDPQLELTAWLKANPQVLEDAGLWCEDGNTNWVHFQCLQFGSWSPGKLRWFKP
jgi:uncharacterized protein YcbK (DUF882 family)